MWAYAKRGLESKTSEWSGRAGAPAATRGRVAVSGAYNSTAYTPLLPSSTERRGRGTGGDTADSSGSANWCWHTLYSGVLPRLESDYAETHYESPARPTRDNSYIACRDQGRRTVHRYGARLPATWRG